MSESSAQEETLLHELRRTIAWMDTVLANVDEAVMVASENQRVTYVNDRGAGLLGQERIFLLGRTLTECLPFLKDDLADPNLSKNSLEVGPLKFPTPSGDRVLEGRVRRLPGEPIQFIAIIRDVTQRQRLEEELRQAQKMDGLGRLAGGIAHDFNNLLTVILGNCSFLQDQLGEKHPSVGDVQEIKRAGERAASLTQQLLAFSRKQVLQPKALNLNDVVSGMGPMLSRLIGEDVEQRTRLEKGLDLIRADRAQVEQVILNLALNARDAMSSGGILIIETMNITLDEFFIQRHTNLRPGPYVMLVVTDTGPGMPPEILSKIFEPFYTTKEVGKGTGLGLATVYGIVKQSGGQVWVYSEVGYGTTLKVCFPRIQGEVGIHEDAQVSPARPRGRETILLTEDEPAVLNLVTRLLQNDGYQVFQAQNGMGALKTLEQLNGKIDLLITDVIMPGMTGQALAQRATTLQPNLKVLYMSGYTNHVALDQSLLMPGQAFIQKPFAGETFFRKIRQVLEKK